MTKLVLSEENLELIKNEYESIGEIEKQLKEQITQVNRSLKRLRLMKSILKTYLPKSVIKAETS